MKIYTLNLEVLKKGKSLSWLSLKTKVSLDKLKKIQKGSKSTINFSDLKKIIDSSTPEELKNLVTIKEVPDNE